MGDGGMQGMATGAQARSALDRAYEERLLASWHERTGISADTMRQLLNGAKTAARGGVGVRVRVPLIREEVESWLAQLVGVMSLLGGLTVTDIDRKPGTLGARYDTCIEVGWRASDVPGSDAEVEHLHERQQMLTERFTTALFLAYAPSVRGTERERVLAVARRLAGPTPTCRTTEMQLHHLARLSRVWLDEQFTALTAGI